MKERTRIYVHVLEHKATGLLMAVSDSMPGLVIHGHSPEEIESKLPGAVRDLLEAEGHRVVSITVEPDDRTADTGFGPPAFIANASLAAMAQ